MSKKVTLAGLLIDGDPRLFLVTYDERGCTKQSIVAHSAAAGKSGAGRCDAQPLACRRLATAAPEGWTLIDTGDRRGRYATPGSW